MRRLRQRVHYHLPLGGLLFILGILVVGLAAIVSANNLLFLVWAAMLATMLVSGFVGRLSLSGLAMDLTLPEHVSARRKASVVVSIRNLKSRVPSFAVRLIGTDNSVLSASLYWPVIPGSTTFEERVDVVFERRGRHAEESFLFSSGFPFGFLERRVQVPLSRDVIVYPCLDPQPGFEELLHSVIGEMGAHQRGLGLDFYRIRPYVAFESARQVDWKATAHTGELQVREFLREQECPVELYFDLAVPEEHQSWFEHAVDCCAFLAFRISLRGGALHFRTQEYSLSVPVEGDIYGILKYLALVRPLPGKSPSSPRDDHAYAIAISASPVGMQEWGWSEARLLGPDTMPPAVAGAGSSKAAGSDSARATNHRASSADQHHGN
jgi:uncharacterized protein (DUF58 family)